MISIEGVLLIIGAVFTGVPVVFASLRRSRCTEIRCLCVYCKRDVLSEDMLEKDLEFEQKAIDAK